MVDIFVMFVIQVELFVCFDKVFFCDVLFEVDLSWLCLGKLIEVGDVIVNGVVIMMLKYKVVEGDIIEVCVIVVEDSYIIVEDILLIVVFEDDYLIVIDKLVGMVVYFVFGMLLGMLVNVLMYYCGNSFLGVGGEKCFGIVYCIDKEISGLLVVVKDDKVYYGLVVQFEKYIVEWWYFVVCYGVLDQNDL